MSVGDIPCFVLWDSKERKELGRLPRGLEEIAKERKEERRRKKGVEKGKMKGKGKAKMKVDEEGDSEESDIDMSDEERECERIGGMERWKLNRSLSRVSLVVGSLEVGSFSNLVELAG